MSDIDNKDTRGINANRQDIDALNEIWLFGYGSLIYKVDFPILEKQPAILDGYARRFWQGSHDHRGTPSQPGRVLTLTKDANAHCFGIAYRITAKEFDHLDHREKNGYLRVIETITLCNGIKKPAVIYIGKPDNAAFLGPATEDEIAKHIFLCQGPSGKNRDYVYNLADSLRTFQQYDAHVFAIESLLRDLENDPLLIK